MRSRVLVVAILIMVSTPALATSPEGRWEMPGQEVWMTITKQDATYLVQVTCSACAFPGAYIGPYKDNILMISSPYGVILYNPSDDTISYVGEKLLRRQ